MIKFNEYDLLFFKTLNLWLAISQFSIFLYIIATEYSRKEGLFIGVGAILVIPLLILVVYFVSLQILLHSKTTSRQGFNITPLQDGLANLKINRAGISSITETKIFLSELEFAYKSLCYFFDALALDADSESIELYEPDLTIEKVVFKSPGFWEFVGKLNPLEVVRQLMKDMHERKKDFSYRNEIEKQKLSIENKLLETKLIKERIELLKEAGISQEAIQIFLRQNVINPLYKANDIDANPSERDFLDEGENNRLLE